MIVQINCTNYKVVSQVSGLTLDQYVNLADQLKLALNSIQLSSPNPATQYFFEEYLELINQPLLVDPLQRTSRRMPTCGQEAVDRRQGLLAERVGLHQAFLEEVIDQAKHYWYNHLYWERQPSNTLSIQNLGHLFNKLRECLSLPKLDAVKPSHTRCGGCHQYVKLGDKRHPCSDEQRPVPSLVASFKPVTTVIPDCFEGLVDGLVSHAAINQLCHNLERNRDEAKLWGAPDTLEGHLKYLICVEPHTVTPAVLQLLLVGLSVACSEGIAETYGTVMELSHITKSVS